MKPSETPKTFEEYFSNFPDSVQDKLKEMRKVIKKAAPDAIEKISYGMPAFTFKGMLLYYAAHTKHIGFYPFTTAIKAFKKDLIPYKTAKGSIQFPLDKPLPKALIRDITAFRVNENKMKEELKTLKKKKKM
jgi:uncharacterized protein YdhG (YjbR/CyaY superfamily)